MKDFAIWGNGKEVLAMTEYIERGYAVYADPVVDYNEHHEHLIDWLQQPAEEIYDG